MLDKLKFVQRGVARRDFVPGLTHFRIKDKRVTGFNGAYALSAPVDIGFNIAPHAALFTMALNACEDVIQLRMEKPDVLIVRSGDFKSAVPCVPLDQVPETFPEGALIPTHESVLDAFTGLREFIGFDASRPWATGILLSGQSAFATNNSVLAEYWLGTPFPHVVNVPSAVVDEVVKVSEELSALQIGTNSITFHYSDGRWIKSQLLALDWPDVLNVLDASWSGSNLVPVPDGLANACEKLTPFAARKDSRLHFRGGDVATSKDGTESGGTLIELPGLPTKGIYHTLFLNQVLAVAEQIDFTKYPLPIPFAGQNLRGAMLGVRE
jgi:hypothetical protein